MQQLNLFSPIEPKWQHITIDWLFDFLNNQYPEMKFCIDCNVLSDGTPVIRQNLHKKIICSFYIGRFDDCVTWAKNRNFIGADYGKCFGDWGRTSYPIDSMEEFREQLPFIIEQSKKNIALYKEYIKTRKKED